jgi:hypothetical protein
MFARLPAWVEDELAMSLASQTRLDQSVAVIGFAGADLRAVEHTVKACGARLLASSGAHGEAPFADILVVDAMDDAAVAFAADRAGGAKQLVVRASLQTIDTIIGLWPDAETVIGSDPVDLHLALVTALQGLASEQLVAFDVASEEGLRLQRLADEIARIARTLIDLPEGLMSPGGGLADRAISYRSAPSDETGLDAEAVTAAEVRSVIRLRRLRERYFPSELFADPAWDMLLDLTAARIERTRVAVSSLCIAAAVPPTTALRWIKAMTDKGLLRRIADPHDARRIFIQLSDDAAQAMDKYLRAARGSAGQAI